MKKKMLVTLFVTTIMLMLPLTAIANDTSDHVNDVNREESFTNLQSVIADPSTVSIDELNNIIINAIEQLSPYYTDDPTFQQIQNMIEEQPLTLEDALFCFSILCLIVFFGALALGMAINTFWDIFAKEGILALIESALAGIFGAIASFFAETYWLYCMDETLGSSPSSTISSNDCGCIQSYNMGEVLQQGLNQL